MEVRVHDRILWHACELAVRRTPNLVDDPRKYFPLMARGSWLQDYCQATIFFDIIRKSVDSAGGAILDRQKARLAETKLDANMRTLLNELWRKDARGLLATMKDEWHASGALIAEAQKKLELAMHIDGLGAYVKSDHWDVLDQRPEFAQEEERFFRKEGATFGRSKCIDDVADAMKYPLRGALDPLNGDTFTWSPMTEFGKALHIMADFFAHTNYVELLLWSLANDGYLSKAAVDGFNTVPSIPPGGLSKCLCPLPPKGEVERRTQSNTMFFYRETPAETPLVSTLFVLDDTAYTLLMRFADHLKRMERDMTEEEFEKELDEQMDLVMALFNMGQSPVTSAAMGLYKGAKVVLRDVGKAVRTFLADNLQRRAKDPHNAEHRDKLELAARLMKRLDAAEAAKWAKSGEYTYVAYSIERELAKKLDFGSTPLGARRFCLPHHTLLRKDENKYAIGGVPDAPTLVRYRLACLLAVNATARLIEWRFAATRPERSDALRIRDEVVRHPSVQLAAMDDDTRLRALGGQMDGIAWADWETFLADTKRMDAFLEVIP